MKRKQIVGLILVGLLFIMIFDFKINGAQVLGGYFNQMVTESMKINNLSNLSRTNTVDDEVSKRSSTVINASGIDKLNMSNPLGDIKISGSDRDDIQVDYEVIVYTTDQEQAEEFIKKIEVNHEKNSGELSIYRRRVKRPNYINGIKINYNIKAPYDIVLNLDNQHGRLEVKNFKKSARLSNEHGKFLIKDITGSLRVDLEHSEGQILQIANNLTLDSEHSEITIDEIGKDTEIRSEHSDIEVEDLAGVLIVDIEHGDFTYWQVRNDLQIKAEHADLRLELAEDLTDYHLNCRIEHGSIDSNLPLIITEDDNIKELTGKSGTGEVKLKIDAEHGEIDINRSR